MATPGREAAAAPSWPAADVAAGHGLGIRLAWRAVRAYAPGYHHVRLVSACALPPAGPAILISNHISGLDPVLLQAACPRLITWMMAREYYEMRSLNWFFRMISAIPVDRSGRDLAATRTALRALEAGSVLGIFPEGRIERGNDMLPFQTGAAMLALKSRAPVYPARIEGSARGKGMLEVFLQPQRLKLAFGGPVQLDYASESREVIVDTTLRLQQAVTALRESV